MISLDLEMVLWTTFKWRRRERCGEGAGGKMSILGFRKLTRCWEFHTQFQCWRTVDGEKWKWRFGVGLSCSFLPGTAFLILLASLLQNQRLGYAAGNLGTELEAATILSSHTSSSMWPCPWDGDRRKKILMGNRENRVMWAYGKMADLNSPLLLLLLQLSAENM